MPDAAPTVVEPFKLLARGVDVSGIQAELEANPEFWNAHRYRKDGPGSPHAEMDDIWVRYNDLRPYEARGDFTGFNDPHIPIWYPAWYAMPELRKMVMTIANLYGCEMLGAVLITRIPPGAKIARHVDRGWHVNFFEKLYLSIKAGGAVFATDTQETCPDPGDLWLFDNRVPHWVTNDSDEERITLIICLRTAVFGRPT